MTSTTLPTDFNYRSMLHHDLAERGAVFESLGDRVIAMNFGEPAMEQKAAHSMAIADLSPLPRTGFKGQGAPAWLNDHGLILPEKPNTAVAAPDGTVIAALSWDEHLILSGLDSDGGLCNKLNAAWQPNFSARCYQLPRADSHAWFAVSGSQTPEMLSKVCGIDMRLHKYADHQIAQTSLARLTAIILRNDLGETPVFYVLADSASAEYLWACLLDAMEEFGSHVVGLEALRRLHG